MMIKEQGRKKAQNTQKGLELVWTNYNSSNINTSDNRSFTQWPSIVTCMKVTSPSQFSSSVLDNFRAMGTSQCNHLPRAEFLLQVQKQEKDSAMIIHFGNLH